MASRYTKNRLSALYRECVGYCPFEDDPTATCAEVLLVLKQWRKASRVDENYIPLKEG